MDLAVGVAVDLHGLYRRQPGGGMASQTPRPARNRWLAGEIAYTRGW